jgi:phosphoglycolate phosphatase
MTRRLLLFDIDGTLMVSWGRGMRAMAAAFQHVFGRAPRDVTIHPQGRTDAILFEEMAAAYDVAPGDLGARLGALHAVYAARLEALLREPQAITVEPGVGALLEELRTRPRVRLGVVSGNLERSAWLKLEAAGLGRFFTGGAFGSDARERAQLVALAVQRFSAADGAYAPEHVWVIGDTPEDVAAGRAHGVHTLGVATGRDDMETLRRAGADVVLPDLGDTVRVVDILCGGG